MDTESAKKYKPDFPLDGFKAKTSGFAVFDFQINPNGIPQNVTLAAVSDKMGRAFERESKKALRRLKFTLTEEWRLSCSQQKYRIGYAYRLMSACTYQEFPKPIINVCATGMIEKIHGPF